MSHKRKNAFVVVAEHDGVGVWALAVEVGNARNGTTTITAVIPTTKRANVFDIANPVLVDHRTRSHCIGMDFFVPADGVDAATCGNGDVGTSPFYGQTQMSDARNSASCHATITAPFPKTQPTSTSAGMLFFGQPTGYLCRTKRFLCLAVNHCAIKIIA
jgi:hypothetical protein